MCVSRTSVEQARVQAHNMHQKQHLTSPVSKGLMGARLHLRGGDNILMAMSLLGAISFSSPFVLFNRG